MSKDKDKRRRLKWECNNCRAITQEYGSEIKGADDLAIPEGGWACINGCGMKGRRKLLRKK